MTANKVALNDSYPGIKKSEFFFKKAKKIIPSVTQTLAKGPSQYVNGVAPKYLEKGKGCNVWDVDGNEFIDFNMGIGPISLGYCYPLVDEAIKKQIDNGITFSLMNPLEVEVSELISSTIPFAESVRFSKSGCDVTSAAVRVARAFTRRDKIITCGYHGWHDWTICTTSKNLGIPKVTQKLTSKFNYNDIDSLINVIDNETAAVIMEPMLFEYPKEDFLQKVRDICNQYGTLLIFDEMWTGFRISPGGAQEYFNVRADLATFSKAVANGMPLSVLSGRRDVMSLFDEQVWFYTTFGGECLSLAAAKATINEIKDKHVTIDLQEKGKILIDKLNHLFKEKNISFLKCVGMGARSILMINSNEHNPLLIKSLLQQELIKCGILWQGMHSLSFSHKQEHVDYLVQCYEKALIYLSEALKSPNPDHFLKGEMVTPVFRTVTAKQ